MSKNSLISTTKLAKIKKVKSEDLFIQFNEVGYIERFEDKWKLTDKGKEAGGMYHVSEKFGQYVVWPDDISIPESKINITSTEIGKHFDTSAQKINHILSEIGWLEKAIKGWQLTESGKRMGGSQKEVLKSGVPYVIWPNTIIENKILSSTIQEVLGKKETSNSLPSESNFRDKFQAEHRCSDGHLVRSRAEMLIDNWLYMAEITHAYERRLPIEEEVYSDFYIPSGKVYIEFWGLEDNPKYQKRKQDKLEIYKSYNFNLIELTDKEVSNLDDYLPRLLLKFGIQSY